MGGRTTQSRHERTALSDEERREFLKALGVGGAVATSGYTLEELQDAIGSSSSAELASIGEAIRADLTGRLDAKLLNAELGSIVTGMERLPELRTTGFPDGVGTAYQELAAPAWTAYDHLAETGFFESAEVHLQRFTEAHIASSARELVRAEPIASVLSDMGFDEDEKLALLSNVVTESERLTWWVPTSAYPDGVDEFDPANIAPLQQRATGGALLWIDELDQHLWQRRVLITEEMLDRGMWDVRAMLAGIYLVAMAARDIAGPTQLTDSQLAAVLTGGTAIVIVGQEDIAADLFRITDEMRAPRGGA